MRLKDRVFNITRWNYYSLSILLFAIVIQSLKWPLFPIFLDVYYHLLTAVGFNEAGGWVVSCFWEFAPIGRPQLYPPLIHFVILIFLKLHIPILVVGKLVQFAVYPLLLFTIWYVIREIFDERLAFFSLFLLFSIYSFYLTAINTLAASLSLIFCFLSLLFLERNKILTSSILFTLALYTHGFTPWLFLVIFISYSIFNKKIFMSSLRICLLALFLASPILIYQIIMRNYYVFQKNLAENYLIELNIFHWSIFLFGLITCFKKKGRYYIFIALFLSSFLLLFKGFIFRYITFYGIMSLVFMNAVFLNNVYDKLNKRYRKIFFAALIILFFIFSPSLSIDLFKNDKAENIADSSSNFKYSLIYRKGNFTLNFLDSSLSNFIFYYRRIIRANDTTIYFPRFFSEITNVIIKNTNDRDIIYVNFPYTGGVLSLLSRRATSCAMLSEVKPYKLFDQIAVAKLIIWQKDPDDTKKEPVSLIERYNLKKIAETGVAFIYENPNCSFKKQVLTATISYKILFVLLFLVFVFLVTNLLTH